MDEENHRALLTVFTRNYFCVPWGLKVEEYIISPYRQAV